MFPDIHVHGAGVKLVHEVYTCIGSYDYEVGVCSNDIFLIFRVDSDVSEVL